MLDDLVQIFGLRIGLWVSRRCIIVLDAIYLTHFFEVVTIELGCVVSDDCVWHPKSINDCLGERISIPKHPLSNVLLKTNLHEKSPAIIQA